ncbi:hypothetical protein DKK70_00720 [Gilliamella apicola]|uniref:Uncharacterized protein n=1 Tax=Gilliamella apicola TaxID=1196095 RepID=A0A2V4E5S5_9GAMM|nr:hypothetical protein [Gilliamella apicola]PXZ08675.1 hypothetical protein DKK70_00720 [Gilliamella apicola]
MIINNKLKKIDLSKPGTITEVDFILHSIEDMPNLSLGQIFTLCPEREDIGSILVGLCALHYLKCPAFNFAEWKAYKNRDFSFEEKQLMISGLLNVIKYSHIEISDEIDALDYIYAACIALNRISPEAEAELVKELKLKPKESLIEALGILVGHEVKGYITKETFLLLKHFAEQNSGGLSDRAKIVLKEDVERMNAINHFL